MTDVEARKAAIQSACRMVRTGGIFSRASASSKVKPLPLDADLLDTAEARKLAIQKACRMVRAGGVFARASASSKVKPNFLRPPN